MTRLMFPAMLEAPFQAVFKPAPSLGLPQAAIPGLHGKWAETLLSWHAPVTDRNGDVTFRQAGSVFAALGALAPISAVGSARGRDAHERRRIVRHGRRAGQDLDDAEPEDLIGDPQAVFERLEQRCRTGELEQVVLGFGLVPDRVGHRSSAPMLGLLDRAAGGSDRRFDVGKDLRPGVLVCS